MKAPIITIWDSLQYFNTTDKKFEINTVASEKSKTPATAAAYAADRAAHAGTTADPYDLNVRNEWKPGTIKASKSTDDVSDPAGKFGTMTKSISVEVFNNIAGDWQTEIGSSSDQVAQMIECSVTALDGDGKAVDAIAKDCWIQVNVNNEPKLKDYKTVTKLVGTDTVINTDLTDPVVVGTTNSDPTLAWFDGNIDYQKELITGTTDYQAVLNSDGNPVANLAWYAIGGTQAAVFANETVDFPSVHRYQYDATDTTFLYETTDDNRQEICTLSAYPFSQKEVAAIMAEMTANPTTSATPAAAIAAINTAGGVLADGSVGVGGTAIATAPSSNEEKWQKSLCNFRIAVPATAMPGKTDFKIRFQGYYTG